MKNILFAEPDHKIKSAILVIPAIYGLSTPFFSQGMGSIGFFGIGLSLALIACAAFLPKSSTKTAGIMRIMGFSGIFISSLFMIIITIFPRY